jgi:putative transposase
VHFFDPELKQYFAIPYRDTSHPPMSVWEWRDIRRRLRQEGRDSTDEDAIFRAYEQLRSIEDTAVNKTKEMRRNIERRHSRPTRAAAGLPAVTGGEAAGWDEEIQPFREVILPS